MKSAIVNF